MGRKILVVEDEVDILSLIELHLKRERYEVVGVDDGEKALQLLSYDSPLSFDLAIVDWMLPGMSGLDILKKMRSSSIVALRRLPALMLTARTEAADIVLGLESGADDYVTKPFEIPVLLARVRALMRRAELMASGADPTSPSKILLGGLQIDPESYEVRCHGVPVNLTPSEFKLLLTLIQNRGRVFSRDKLIEAVQGEGVTVIDRAIDTHVFGLRKKLGECADWIETVRGIGYRVKIEGGP